MPARPLPAATSVAARLREAGCVYAEDEARLLLAAADGTAQLDAMISRRAAGEPVEHVVGWAQFCGLRIAVDPGVFVPRRRSEFLVSQAAAVTRRARAQRGNGTGMAPLVIVDLCCGSGAVGAALAAALGPAELYAADIDEAAVDCARRNLATAGGHVCAGDLYDALPAALAGRIGLLTVNPPYVPTAALGTLPAEARDHEPRVALDGGPDGLSIARRVLAGALRWLAPGGHVLIEASEEQARRICHAASASGLVPRVAVTATLEAAVVIGRSRRS